MLLGHSGMTKVDNVTGYYNGARSIFLEVNAGGDTRLQNSGKLGKACTYFVVDKASGKVTSINSLVRDDRGFRNNLRSLIIPILSRSCLST